MQKTQYRALARVGAVASLKTIEAQLGQIFQTFPDLFVGNMRPQFLKPELQNGSAPQWPEFTKRETLPPPGGGEWTAKRRKEQAARMRTLQRAGKLGRRSAAATDEAKREYQRKYRLRKKQLAAAEQKIHRYERAHRKTLKAPQTFFGTSYQKIYDYVGTHQGETVTQIAKGLGENHPANCTKQLHKMQAIGMLTRAKAFPHGWSRGAVSEAAALKAGAIAPRETKA